MADVKQSIKISYVILFIMMILGLVYALMALISPQMVVMRSFQGFIGQSWFEFVAANPTLSKYILLIERMAGGLGLAVSIGGLFVLMTAFRKAEKWAWWYVLVVGIIAWVNNLIPNLIVKNTMNTTIIIIGLALIIIGLIIPAKDFFSKK